MKKVAVVIPAFNRPQMLERALLSVCEQSRPADEIILVDDASSDDLPAAKALARAQNVKWVQLPKNEGPAAARNRGVSESTADWICFLDSDDVWARDKIERQLDWHKEHPTLVISQVGERWMRNGSEVKKPKHWVQKEGDLFADSVDRCSIGPSCVMIARHLWDEFGGFDPRFRVCEDYELWLRVTALHPVGLVGGPDLVEKYAGHEDQLSVMTPAMDRFRVVALLEHCLHGRFSKVHSKLMADGICAKSTILAAGALKRGAKERADFYEALAVRDLDGLTSAEASSLILGAWRQIEASDSSEML